MRGRLPFVGFIYSCQTEALFCRTVAVDYPLMIGDAKPMVRDQVHGFRQSQTRSV
jgi:hypothetical protein